VGRAGNEDRAGGSEEGSLLDFCGGRPEGKGDGSLFFGGRGRDKEEEASGFLGRDKSLGVEVGTTPSVLRRFATEPDKASESFTS